jgi:hypothetical protein
MNPWPLRTLCAALTLVLCALPQGCASGGAPRQAIESIVLERDCMGCPQGLRIELRSDGRALWALVGKARHRSADREAPGRIEPAAFAALARAVQDAGFFALADQYDDPSLADGSWSQLTVQARGQPAKTVWRRESAGPPALLALEAAIESWRARRPRHVLAVGPGHPRKRGVSSAHHAIPACGRRAKRAPYRLEEPADAC